MRKEIFRMKMVIATVIFILPIMATCSPVLAQEAAPSDGVLIHDGFLSGKAFRDLPELWRRAYAAGMVDGLFLAPLLDAPKSSLRWLESCAEGMTDVQVSAIISKYLEENPDLWHQPVHVVALRALLASCPGTPLER